jgi:hypothetical protein
MTIAAVAGKIYFICLIYFTIYISLYNQFIVCGVIWFKLTSLKLNFKSLKSHPFRFPSNAID